MSYKCIKFNVSAEDANQRLDKYITSKLSEYSRAFIQQLIKNGNVKIDGLNISVQKVIVKQGSNIEIDIPKIEENSVIIPQEFNFEILYEDKELLVINKPAGVVVHPAAGNRNGTVVNALLGKDENFCSNFIETEEINSLDLQRPGIVHRLDKDTSGCLIIAKNFQSKYKLSESFASGEVSKRYLAITYGIPDRKFDKIVSLIGRHPVNRQKMAVVQRNGKEAITFYEILKTGEYNGFKVALLSIKILTGRTHQIRVHLAYKKIPILGDTTYGGKQKIEVTRQMLHAANISFPHPTLNKTISVSAPIPEDFQSISDAF